MGIATTSPQRLGDVLIARGYLTEEQVLGALSAQQEGGRSKLLGEVIVEQELCTEDQVVECLALVYGVPYAKLEARMYDPKVVDVVPREYVENNLALPLFLIDDVLTVAPDAARDTRQRVRLRCACSEPLRNAPGNRR